MPTAITSFYIRWMIRRDMPSVLDIESKSFEYPWTEDDFIRTLRQRNVIGMVVEREDEVAGYMVYELHKTHIHVLSFAVEPSFRRQGAGTAMVEKLVSKLEICRRQYIVLEVRESNLPAQLFFRQNKFRADRIIGNFYKDCDKDAYQMRFRLTGETQ